MKKKSVHLERFYKHPRFDGVPACGFMNAYYFTTDKTRVTCKRCLKLMKIKTPGGSGPPGVQGEVSPTQ